MQNSDFAISAWRTSTVVIVLGYCLDIWLTHLHLPTMGLETSYALEWAQMFQSPTALTAVGANLLLLVGHLGAGLAALSLARAIAPASDSRLFLTLGATGILGAILVVGSTPILLSGALTHVNLLTMDVLGILCFSALNFAKEKSDEIKRKRPLELLLVSTIAGASLLAPGHGWTSYLAAIATFLMLLWLYRSVDELWRRRSPALEPAPSSLAPDCSTL